MYENIYNYVLCNFCVLIIYYVVRGLFDFVVVEFYFILKKFYYFWLFIYNNLYLMD